MSDAIVAMPSTNDRQSVENQSRAREDHPLAMLFMPTHAVPPPSHGVPVVCPDCGLRQMTGEPLWLSGCCQASKKEQA